MTSVVTVLEPGGSVPAELSDVSDHFGGVPSSSGGLDTSVEKMR